MEVNDTVLHRKKIAQRQGRRNLRNSIRDHIKSGSKQIRNLDGFFEHTCKPNVCCTTKRNYHLSSGNELVVHPADTKMRSQLHCQNAQAAGTSAKEIQSNFGCRKASGWNDKHPSIGPKRRLQKLAESALA